MTEISLDVEMPPDVEIEVVQTSVEITVGQTPTVEIDVQPASPIEVSVEPPAVYEITADRASTITVEVGPPPTVNFSVGEPGEAGPPGGPGPAGPPGPTVVSADAGNIATLGSDSFIFVPTSEGGGGGVTDHGLLTGLEDDDHPQYLTQARADPLYVNTTTDSMSGTLTVQDLVIKGDLPEPGLVWTAEDTLGHGTWQEPSALVVAETSDPVLINWFDQSAEGWVKFNGGGTMAFVEMNSPSMPGALDCQGEVWAEWQAAEPMVFEPGALYRVTVRARLDAAAALSFGFQGYNPATPATVVDATNGATTTNPHWCAVGLVAGDAAWIDDVTKPGEWLSWTGYLSGKTDAAAEGIPAADSVAPAEAAVTVAGGVHQWRPAFNVTGGRVWIDAIEVHRLDRSLELPGGIRASDVYAQSVAAITVTTENLVIPPSTDGYLLTAVDDGGNSEWMAPPITVTEGPPQPSDVPENPLTVNLGTSYGRQACMAYLINTSTVITSTSPVRVPGSKAIQFTLATPAMVTLHAGFSLFQAANSASVIMAHVGLEDETGTYLYPDDWGAPTASNNVGIVQFRSGTGGNSWMSGVSMWRRYLQPGTYLVYIRSWVAAVDAGSAKNIASGSVQINIDPDVTYLTGAAIMTDPYLWDGTAWVQTPVVPPLSGSALLADTDQTTVTTLAQPTSPVNAGATVSLSATVKAGATNVTAGSIAFERLNPGGAWTAISTDSVSPWAASYTLPSTLGTYQFRAKYLGSGVYAASTSATKSVVNQAAAVPKTWSGYASASRSYEGDTSLRPDNYDSRCYHGYWSSASGNQRSAMWFSVPSEVKGSNVTKVTIRLTRIGSLGDSSVTIYCGTHADTSVPSDWDNIAGRSPYDTDTFAGDVWSSADNTTTYTLSSAIHAKFEAGAKGLTIGPSSSDYCAFWGVQGVSSSEKPYLTIEYTA